MNDQVEIIEAGISQGKLNGAGNLSSFKGKYNLIKDDGRYKGQKLFFIIDKDFDDSSDIGTLIKNGGDVVQFLEYNFEHLLLKFAGKNPKNPPDFNNLTDFRAYCKREFQNQFNKNPSDFKDSDFDSIFNNISDEEIKGSFNELFSTLS